MPVLKTFKDQAHSLPQRPRRIISPILSTIGMLNDEDTIFWCFSIHKNLVFICSDRFESVPKGLQTAFHCIFVMSKQNMPSEADCGQFCGLYGLV